MGRALPELGILQAGKGLLQEQRGMGHGKLGRKGDCIQTGDFYSIHWQQDLMDAFTQRKVLHMLFKELTRSSEILADGI